MEKEVFDQFEEQFGKEWLCSCGNPFEASKVEVVSKTKTSLLAKYTCSICSKEQMFAVSSDLDFGQKEPAVQIPNEAVGSDDVLDIRQELSQISFGQIKNLVRKASDNLFIKSTSHKAE